MVVAGQTVTGNWQVTGGQLIEAFRRGQLPRQ